MVVPKHRVDFKLAGEIGRKIYNERYRETLEPEHNGKFFALDIESGIGALGEFSTEAMMAARKASPGGFYFLLRVGHDATFTLH